MATDGAQRTCTVVLHDDRISREDVFCGANVLPAGCFARLSALGAKDLCVVAGKAASNPHEVSLHVSLAQRFRFENRTKATIHFIDDVSTSTATHIELFFRDQHLSRADMWRLECAADGRVVYQGQELEYLGSPVATVRAIYIKGRTVESALVSHKRTKLIFRSGSARYTILVQISKEMLEYWREGDLMYERMLLGYLPELFKRWDTLKVRHQVSVVLFGRSKERNVETDFFRVIAMDTPSTQWPGLLRKLKRTFNNFKLPTSVSLAARGNMLEAIHVATLDFIQASVDPYLNSTGTSIIAITAGAGLFETSFERLRRTTHMLMGNGIGVDIVALSHKPLHPVPLFCYMREGSWEYALPHWVDISFWPDHQASSTSNWLMPKSAGCIDDIALPPLFPTSMVRQGPLEAFMDQYDDASFGELASSERANDALKVTATRSPTSSADTERAETDTLTLTVHGSTSSQVVAPTSQEDGRRISSASSITRTKRDSLPPHSLLQSARKISVGPRGLAPSRGIASTTVSVEHAQQGKDVTAAFPPNESSSGLATQIRQSLIRKESRQSLVQEQNVDHDIASKPISIDTGLVVETDDPGDPASVMERKVMETVPEDVLASGAQLSGTPKAIHNKFLSLAKVAEADDKPTNSPWVTLLNPCNPKRENMRVASQYRKWQNVFPKAVSSSAFKWDSMCSPAALPLTIEHQPSTGALEDRAARKVRRILVPPTDDSLSDAASKMLSRLIALRLMHGFQMSSSELKAQGTSVPQQNAGVLMSIGSLHHEIRCLSAAEIQTLEYDGHAIEQGVDTARDNDNAYSTQVTSSLGIRTKTDISFATAQSAPDWSSLDECISGHTEDLHGKGGAKMRFVLIPVEIHRGHHAHQALRELSDEEMRTDGIQRLTQLWQRHRYFTDESHRRQAALVRPKVSNNIPDRDLNPLAIEYQTRDPSAVVNAYGPLLTGQLYTGEPVEPLFAESDMYHSSTFDVARLVKQMQEPPPHGVEVRDRRWFTRFHLRCFRGDEMVNWLLRVFKDLQSREDAIAVGNELMSRGIFSHVRHKHEFRDGNYFYQITSTHRIIDHPDSASMFTKGALRSVPTTPLVEARRSPMTRPAPHNVGSFGKRTPRQTPVMALIDRKQVLLSQVMQYNVDPASKSEQPEIVNLHYDRIHNPDNCYHIQLEWINTTAKLIRDAVSRWTALVDGYGLRLVQVPIAEASKLRTQHPFDVCVPVKLAVRPPESIPVTLQLDAQSFASRMAEDSLAYQKALLRKMDFVLDYEAAASFTTKLDVSYSFGRPDYELTQFVHKSGLVLAQIAGDDRSDFLLLPNRLAGLRPGKAAESETSESIVTKFKAFCRDEVSLKAFYHGFSQLRLPTPSPFTPATSAADSDVPPMQLPPLR